MLLSSWSLSARRSWVVNPKHLIQHPSPKPTKQAIQCTVHKAPVVITRSSLVYSMLCCSVRVFSFFFFTRLSCCTPENHTFCFSSLGVCFWVCYSPLLPARRTTTLAHHAGLCCITRASIAPIVWRVYVVYVVGVGVGVRRPRCSEMCLENWDREHKYTQRQTM